MQFQEDPKRSATVLGCIDQYAHKIVEKLHTDEKKIFDAPNLGKISGIVKREAKMSQKQNNLLHEITLSVDSFTK